MAFFRGLVCLLLGLCVGSFLNVVIWRVPRKLSVVRPPSACPNCQLPIAPRDNIPVVSWILLRGKCRGCQQPISARYPLVELGTALLFLALALRLGGSAALPAYLFAAAVGIALALIDVDVHRLPDALTLPSYPVLLLLLAAAAAVDHAPERLLRAAICGAIAAAFYFALWFAYPRGMGFGDVKLSGLLGLLLGWIGYGALVVGLFLGFVYGGVFGLGLVLFRGGGRKTRVPFGPFMMLGALTSIFVGSSLASAYTQVTFG